MIFSGQRSHRAPILKNAGSRPARSERGELWEPSQTTACATNTFWSAAEMLASTRASCKSTPGASASLTEARRLWYWKPLNNAAFLSGVAVDGLEDSSKVGKPVSRLHLTENCEIIECSPEAEKSIRGQKNHNE